VWPNNAKIAVSFFVAFESFINWFRTGGEIAKWYLDRYVNRS
jgi:hypothetical protein